MSYINYQKLNCISIIDYYTGVENESKLKRYNQYLHELLVNCIEMCGRDLKKILKLKICENSVIPEDLIIPRNLLISKQIKFCNNFPARN